jgi:hypothetical protein
MVLMLFGHLQMQRKTDGPVPLRTRVRWLFRGIQSEMRRVM